MKSYDDYKLSNDLDENRLDRCRDCGCILEDGEDQVCGKCFFEREWMNPEDLEDDNEPFID